MEGFDWAQNNLGAQSPHQLQSEGVNVYFAPNIAPDDKVVNLENGTVQRFQEGEHRPLHGYFADVTSLREYRRVHGLPLIETNGQMSVIASE